MYLNLNTALNPYGYSYEKGHHKGALGKIIELKKSRRKNGVGEPF